VSRALAANLPPAITPLSRLDARVKIVGAVGAIVICVSTPPAAFGAFAVYVLSLIMLIALSRLSLREVGRRAVVVVPFALMVAAFAPFLHADQTGGGISLGLAGAPSVSAGLVVWNVLAKSLLSVTMIVVLTATTPFPELINALRGLWAPEIVVLLLSFTYRYLFVLADEFQKLRRAHDMRGYRGRWLWQASSIGNLIGAMFIRTYERAERIYVAMISRGYEGRFPHLPRAAWRWRDGFAAAAFLGLLLTARVALA
jgi:cobalt/nickel transport system permease protein